MDKKLKIKYLHLIALFLSVLVITIPFYTSSVFAAVNENPVVLKKKTEKLNLLLNGDEEDDEPLAVVLVPIENLNAGEACIEKNEKTHFLVDALDNDVIKIAEQIASIMHAIAAVWTFVKSVLNTIILVLYALSSIPGLQGLAAKAKKLENFRTGVMENIAASGLMTFILSAVGCSLYSDLWGTKGLCEIDFLGANLNPYTNIYMAVGCLCPNAILFNMRKLKTIYQVYNCCVGQACRNGLSTEPCERQLSEATCMYWGKGDLASKIMSVVMGLAIKWLMGKAMGFLMKKLVEKFGTESIPIAGTIASTLQLGFFDYPALQEGLKWMGKTFSEPTCTDLGFDELKEDMKREYAYPKVEVYEEQGRTATVDGKEYIIFDMAVWGKTETYAVNKDTGDVGTYSRDSDILALGYKNEKVEMLPGQGINNPVKVEGQVQLGNAVRYEQTFGDDYIIINNNGETEVYKTNKDARIETVEDSQIVKG